MECPRSESESRRHFRQPHLTFLELRIVRKGIVSSISDGGGGGGGGSAPSISHGGKKRNEPKVGNGNTEK